MARYAIGDIQGCWDSLRALLDRLDFDPAGDRLWLVGDLVNRGPRSLEVLRWARDLGDRAVCVLGNHDLHLLARAAGVAGPKRLDTLEAVLEAPDREELLSWLRSRPLLHREEGYVLLHAGLHPSWSIGEAEALARDAASRLRADADGAFVKTCSRPRPFRQELEGAARAAAAASVLTRIRTCRADGALCAHSGPPGEAPRGCLPWFERRPAGEEACFVFGHWSALGLRVGPRALALDTGCVWRNELTAIRLEDRTVFRQPAID